LLPQDETCAKGHAGAAVDFDIPAVPIHHRDSVGETFGMDDDNEHLHWQGPWHPSLRQKALLNDKLRGLLSISMRRLKSTPNKNVTLR
jgi:hypothetical protein